jgi:hypothetical protein
MALTAWLTLARMVSRALPPEQLLPVGQSERAVQLLEPRQTVLTLPERAQ